MRFSVLFAFLVFSHSALPAAARPGRTRVVIQVDLNDHALRVEKLSKNGRKHIKGPTLPVVKESFHPGVYRPTKLYQRFRSINGNTYLENVIFFDGSHTIRTSRLFDRISQAGNPVSSSIVVEPDFGMILFQTIVRYGRKNTVIQIRK